MLISLTGLPGSGKTTLARRIVAAVPGGAAVHLRIDTIEQAMLRTGMVDAAGGWEAFPTAGYEVAYALAEEQLRAGYAVVADSVNPLAVTRDAWRSVAERGGTPSLLVEVRCSDVDEHRRRVQGRVADLPGHEQPSWSDVLDREYEPVADGPGVLRVDTTDGFDSAVRAVLDELPGR